MTLMTSTKMKNSFVTPVTFSPLHDEFTGTPSSLLSVRFWVFKNLLTVQISDTLSATRPVWHNPLVLFIQRGWSGEGSDSNICGGQSYHLNRTVSVMSSQGCGWQARQEMHIVAEKNSGVHNVTLLFQCPNIHRSNKLTPGAPAFNIADRISPDSRQHISHNSHLSIAAFLFRN